MNEINQMLESMFKKFNSLQKEEAEQSYACRKGIIKSLEKEKLKWHQKTLKTGHL